MASSTPWRGNPARCENPARQLERSREPYAGVRDAPARDLRSPGAWRPRNRPGVERLARSPARRGARRPPGASLRRTTHLRAARARCGARLLRANRYDVVVEDINKLPLFLPGLTDRPFCALVPHLFGATAFREASWPIAGVVWAAERPIPWRIARVVPRYFGEHARRSGAAGRAPRADRSHLSGRRCDLVRPDAAEPRSREPTFLYVGRLKRYKGVEIALRALALAVRRVPTWSSRSRRGDDRGRLERLARTLASARPPGSSGSCPRRISALLRRAWRSCCRVRRRVGHLERGGGGVRYARARVRQSGLRESVRTGETGFLVPHGDARALADRMLALAADPGLWRGWDAGPAALRSSFPGSGRPGDGSASSPGHRSGG